MRTSKKGLLEIAFDLSRYGKEKPLSNPTQQLLEPQS
ncbi:MAG: hypothetical protein K0S95_486 [Pantoea eucrina]|jgi:hypothetical protein|nr:hypothetical protein [Pantoea eucrina]